MRWSRINFFRRAGRSGQQLSLREEVIELTEEQAKEYLRNKGCPEFVWKGGSVRLILDWENFVSEVEKGYCPRCLIDEYWNDLDTRELIHEIGFDDRVEAADKRFRAMLTATTIKHHKRDRVSDYDFWNYGYPKNASGFFLEQIKEHVLGQH